MTITSSTVEPGIVAVTVNHPPVNALPSRGWFELADTITQELRIAMFCAGAADLHQLGQTPLHPTFS